VLVMDWGSSGVTAPIKWDVMQTVRAVLIMLWFRPIVVSVVG
jgi:hypothetical protein